MLSVKDECKDEEISEAITVVKHESSSDVETDLKACPYCPAVFESGISLSNHIRGHLHRVGLKVRNAAAKVTSLEKVPPVRRRTLSQVKTGDASLILDIFSCIYTAFQFHLLINQLMCVSEKPLIMILYLFQV